MLSHEFIWNAIDSVAKAHQLSPSALARLAGLDPTSFNPSKRFKADGRPRWPSTESISKVLQATNTSAAAFFGPASPSRRTTGTHWSEKDIAALRTCQNWLVWPMSDARNNHLPDSLTRQKTRMRRKLNGEARNTHTQPMPDYPAAIFALRVEGEDFAPYYRDGATLLLSNDGAFDPGDRVIMLTRTTMILGDIEQIRQRSISVTDLSEGGLIKTCSLSAVEWVARILWASQ